MNYYSHHIGDFDRATRHLSRIERSVYRDLIDMYYDTEKPLMADLPALCRKIIARTDEEVTAVEQVLNEFFIITPVGWYHDRCEEELEAYRATTTQKSAAGKASAAKRLQKRLQAMGGCATLAQQEFNENPTAVERAFNGASTNQEPRTINQEPVQNLSAADLAPEPELQPTPDTQPNGAAVLSIAFRKAGIQTQPADPRLIALAEQGISVETVASACADAKARKPGESVGLPYVLTILKTWAKAAEALKVAGATPQARASPAYASTRDQRRSAAARGIGLGGDNHGLDGNIIDINCRTITD